MWGDLFGGKKSAGTLADGGTGPTCTRATHQQLLASLNTSCTLTSECPSGAFCDLDVGAFCNFQCEHSDDCPSNQVCDCLGRCVGELPDAAAPSSDPACPRNVELISIVTSSESGKRVCNFDDVCPYGTHCDEKTATCEAECLSDSECATGDGGARICDCFGRCVTPGSSAPPPRTNLPSLTVTPGLIEIPLPIGATEIPVKPTFTTRQIDATLRSTVSHIYNGDQVGGPRAAVFVKAGKYLNVQCRVPCVDVDCATVTYTEPAKECTLMIYESNWHPDHDDLVATQPVRVLPSDEEQEPTEESMKTWSVSFHTGEASQSARVVNITYSHFATGTAPPRDLITSPLDLHGGYTGFVELLVRDQTSTVNEPNSHTYPMKLPVYGIARGDVVYIFDPSLLLSATGVIYVYMDGLPGQIISWVNSQPEIGTEGMSMLVNETVRASEFYQLADQSLSGSIQIKNLMFGAMSDTYIPGRFMLKRDIMPSCDPMDTTLTQIECPLGMGCVHGFCTNPVPNPPIYSQGDFSHNQEADYLDLGSQRSLLHAAADDDFVTPDDLICRVGQIVNHGSLGTKLFRFGAHEQNIPGAIVKEHTINGFLKLSGDAPCVTGMQGLQGQAMVGARAIPLLTNADSAAQKKAWVEGAADGRLDALGASELLGRCLSELKRKAPAVENIQALPPELFNASLSLAQLGRGYFETEIGANRCVSLGNFFGALELSTYQKDWPAYGLLVRQWLELHSFIASQGLEEHELNLVLQSANAADQLGSSTPGSAAANYEALLDVVESGLWFSLSNLAQVVKNLPGADVPGFDAMLVNPDYRQGAGVPQASSNPQYEQTSGILPAILEALTTELRLANAFMADANLKTYQESFNQYSPMRAKAIRRYGFAMRTALLLQNLAVNLHDRAAYACGHTVAECSSLSWEPRWKVALNALRVARQGIVANANRLVRVENPLGISEFDVPIFFGDPVGTNSRYFASSDYLLEKWAAPAVQTASNDLDQARQAWISQRNSKLQDELSTADRERRLEQLAEQYGRPIIQSCGFDTVDGAAVTGKRAIDLITSGRATPDNCYLDPACPGFENVWKPEEIVAQLAPQIDDQSIKFAACMTENTQVSPKKATFIDHVFNGVISSIAQTIVPLKTEVTECLTKDAASLTLVNEGAAWTVQGLCDGEPFSAPLQKWMAGRASDGPEVPEQYRRAARICSELYGYKPIPRLPIPVSCLRGRLGEAIAAGVGATAGLKKTIVDLSVTRQQMTEKGAYCLSLNQNEADRQRLAEAYHTQLDIAVQTSINAAATSAIGSYEAWIEQIFANEWPKIAEKIDRGLDVANEAYQAADSVLPDWVLDNPLTNASPGLNLIRGRSGPNAQGAEDLKMKALGYHSNGLATDFATQAEAVAEEGQLRRIDTAYREAVDRQRAEEASGACWLEYHTMKIGMDSQIASIDQAMTEVERAATAAKNVQREIPSLAMEGAAALEREKNRKWDGYAFHYWSQEKVDRFKKDFDWAKRLTFLAARAVEFEFQQSLPFRATVLAAHHPDQLADVVRSLQQEQAARTLNRRRPEESSVVLSLRDDILRISDRSSAEEGERNWTPAQRFKGRLRSPGYAVRDQAGNLMGQGIPFTMDPLAGADTSGVGLRSRCGERLWRVTATIQGDGLSSREPGASVLLLQRNSFHSQFCEGHGGGAPMQSVSIQPSRVLFRPDDQALPIDESRDFTASQLYPWFNIRRSDFYKKSFQDGASEELAGRGLYGDYVLIFPQNLLDAGFPLERVEDVLMRFDYLSVDNLPQISRN